MKKLLSTFLVIFFCNGAFAQPTDTELKSIPFEELGPASALPLNLTVPTSYVWLKKYLNQAGIIVLCDAEDEASISDSGDFSKANNAVITLRQSPSDYFDRARNRFSFEENFDAEVRRLGGKNAVLEKMIVKGIPVASITFEVGAKKLYSLAIASQGSMIWRLSYNARAKPRSHDDDIWKALVNGL